MSISVTAIVIVAIIVGGIVRLARIQHGTDRRSMSQPLLHPSQPSPRELELQKEVEDLRERIQVLERIATDGRPAKALAAEIESLRDA